MQGAPIWWGARRLSTRKTISEAAAGRLARMHPVRGLRLRGPSHFNPGGGATAGVFILVWVWGGSMCCGCFPRDVRRHVMGSTKV